jgi:hypothetical protein
VECPNSEAMTGMFIVSYIARLDVGIVLRTISTSGPGLKASTVCLNLA